MSAEVTPGGASGAPTGLGPGTVVGGRFAVEREERRDALGQVWLSRDQKTGKQVTIRTLSATLVPDPAAYDAVRTVVKQAAKLRHRNLALTYGVGTQGSQPFVAHEWINGSTVADLVSRRRGTGRPMSLRGIYNVIAHVCKGLSALHAGLYHGSIRPDVVWVTQSGRVKLSEVGLGHALVTSGLWTALEPEQQAYLAPEIRGGAPADVRVDVFGVGSLMYHMLTGRTPLEEYMPPSQAHPDATEALDAILMRCLAGNPDERYPTPDEVVRALLPLVATAPEADPSDFDAEVEIDVDIAASLAPPAPDGIAVPAASGTTNGALHGHAPEGPGGTNGMAPPGASIPVDFSLPPAEPEPPAGPAAGGRVSPAPGIAPPPPPPRPSPANARPALNGDGDLGGLVESLSKDSSTRWMVSKEGMDHGPFSARELIKLIVEGEVLEHHNVLNMGTNERKPLSKYEEFSEFLAQQKIRKAEADHQAALERSDKVEKRSKVATFFILAGVIVAVVGAGSAYWLSRKAAEAKVAKSDLDLAALYESGNVKIEGTAGILKHTRRAGGSKGSRKSSGGGAGGFNSYEDAMNIAMEMGDATRGGGERQLTSSDVAGTMNRNLNSLFSCVSQELRSGGRLKNVVINLAIQGSGSVLGASVTTGSPAFKKCIVGKVRRIKFPSFPAPRMGARYSFAVD